MIRSCALTDRPWSQIQDLLPGGAGHVGAPAKDNRPFVDAVLYRYRAGIAWRDLPERFGDFRVVHLRHMRWSRSGVWQRVFRVLAQEADKEYAMIDATVVRAHQHSAGGKEGLSASHRAQLGRLEHEDPRHSGCPDQSHRLRTYGGPGLRSEGASILLKDIEAKMAIADKADARSKAWWSLY